MPNWIKSEEEIGEILSCQDAEGNLSTDEVLKRASDESSLIHKYFTWDDSDAANEYRRMQARQIIRRVPVVYLHNGVEKTIPRFVSIIRPSDETRTRRYVDVVDLSSDDEARNEAVKEALREIRRWQDIYNSYNELQGIVNEEEVVRLEGDNE